MLFNDVGVASVAVLSQLKAIITIIVCKHIQFNLFSIVLQKNNKKIYYLKRRLILYYIYICTKSREKKITDIIKFSNKKCL